MQDFRKIGSDIVRVSHLVLGLAFLTAACDSVGGPTPAPSPAPTPTPTPANLNPTITSPATATVVENSATVFYTVTATDPEGAALAYSITGGEDADHFQITANGGLSFKIPPNFERPTDRNRMNRYQVQVTVRDPGDKGHSLPLTVTVTDSTAGNFRVRRLATGFDKPVYLTSMSHDSDKVAVVERTGRIKVFSLGTRTVAAGAPYLDISSQITTDGHRGLLGLALSPEYHLNPKAYIFMTNMAGDIEVRKYDAATVGGVRDFHHLDAASGDVILRVPHSSSNLNYGGWMGFGSRDTTSTPRPLYITTGDAADCDRPLTAFTIVDCNARGWPPYLGKVLRINPEADDYPTDPNRDYGIPAGNRSGDPVIMSGLRNPYRASFDRSKLDALAELDEFWIGDQGHDSQEEINYFLVPHEFLGGNNAYVDWGWPYLEGTREKVFDTTPKPRAPRVTYQHGAGPLQGTDVVGGYVYHGPVESLQGVYIFGDMASGRIILFKPGELIVDRNADFVPDAGTIDHITSFGEDLAGNLYILDEDGEIFRVEPA